MIQDNNSSEKVVAEVLAERKRQKEFEGWTPEHDDSHARGTLAKAAAAYAWSAVYEWGDGFTGPRADARHAMRHWGWPWGTDWWKPKGPRRDLVRAAALIVAEIERLDRRQNYVPDYRDDSELDT